MPRPASPTTALEPVQQAADGRGIGVQSGASPVDHGPRDRVCVPFELGVFALAALAIGTASVVAGVVLAVAVPINAALLTAFGQWEN